MVLGREPNHQRIGERPGLAAEIADIADVNAHFLKDLALGALFQRLTGLDKAGDYAVATWGKGGIQRKRDRASIKSTGRHATGRGCIGLRP